MGMGIDRSQSDWVEEVAVKINRLMADEFSQLSPDEFAMMTQLSLHGSLCSVFALAVEPSEMMEAFIDALRTKESKIMIEKYATVMERIGVMMKRTIL